MYQSRDAKERMIKATMELLLSDGQDIARITVRQIAQRANVSVGSISYHFGSKDNLLSAATENAAADMVKNLLQRIECSDISPESRLKAMLKALFNLSVSKEKLAQFVLVQVMQRGRLHAPLYLIPVLKELFQDKEELGLRILALQLLKPIETATAAPAAFLLYCGVDVYNEDARNQLIDTVVENLLRPSKHGTALI